MTLPLPHLAPLGAALAWAVVSDLRRRRIPNAATIFVIGSGLLIRAADATAGHRLLEEASGLAAASLSIVALYGPWRAGGIGGGDVKLAAAVAAWVGLDRLLWFALATAVAGGLVASACYLGARAPERAEVRSNLTLAVLQGELPAVRAPARAQVAVPYGVAIAVGAALALLVVR